jgi:transposase-like protein
MPRSSPDLVPVRLVARRRWSANEARTILESLDGSRLSVREFAARHGVDAQRLYRWRAQLAAAAPAFLEIKQPASEAIEVVLRSGYVIRLKDGFGEDVLRRVVAVLDVPVAAC